MVRKCHCRSQRCIVLTPWMDNTASALEKAGKAMCLNNRTPHAEQHNNCSPGWAGSFSSTSREAPSVFLSAPLGHADNAYLLTAHSLAPSLFSGPLDVLEAASYRISLTRKGTMSNMVTLVGCPTVYRVQWMVGSCLSCSLLVCDQWLDFLSLWVSSVLWQKEGFLPLSRIRTARGSSSDCIKLVESFSVSQPA